MISTLNQDGSVHNTVVWISAEDGAVAVNSAVGRMWPANLKRDPRVPSWSASREPYNFVEIRGTATATTDGADEHIDALAKKYIGQDEFPFRQPGDLADQVRDRARPRPASEAGLAAFSRRAAGPGGRRDAR